MVRTYEFEEAFANDWLPTILSRVAEEVTARSRVERWNKIGDETLVDEGKRQWERLKRERAEAGEEGAGEWTLPYLWEWGPDRFRLPLRRELRRMQAERLGLPPPISRKKRKAGDPGPRFDVPTRLHMSPWCVFPNSVSMEQRKSEPRFDNVEELSFESDYFSTRTTIDASLAASVASLENEDVKKVIESLLASNRGVRLVASSLVPIKESNLCRARLQNRVLIERATSDLAQILPKDAVFAPEESRFDILRVDFGQFTSGATPHRFDFSVESRRKRLRVFCALDDDVVIGIRAPLPVSSSAPYGEYIVPVPRGAALVVVATCSTSLRRGADYHAAPRLILYTEVAFGEPREPPEDVRSKEPFFHVDE